MRSFAPAQFSIRRFALWRAALGLLFTGAAASLVAWSLALPGSLAAWQWLALVLAVGVLAVLTWPLAHPAALRLRWDGRCWHLGPIDAVGREPHEGELSVAIDLGHWMLLHFRPAKAGAGAAPGWIAAQRRGHEPQWHALRCALYSPRQAANPGGVSDV